MVAIRNRISPIFHNEWPLPIITLVAIILRIYKISAQPLWLDEIYAVQLSRQGLSAIIQNSLRDPHPPVYYILQMLTSGLWNVQSEWGWRWLSALCGIVTIPVFYFLCRRFSGRMASSIAALTLAVSPFHVYYSQEARPYAFVTLLAVVTTSIVADLLANQKSRSHWIALTLLSFIGLFSNYFYALIIGVQALILLLRTHQREWWIYALIMASGIGLDGYFISTGVSNFLQQNINAQSLTIVTYLQALAGEPARFAVRWQHWLLMAVVGGVVILGSIIAIRRWRKSLLEFYFFLQLLLALLFFFGLEVAFSFRLPKHVSRQLLMLIPALFSLLAIGMNFLGKYWKQIIPASLCVLILIASGAGINAYWHMTKSPEGSLILHVRPEILSSDLVVSLDYSISAAAYFYLPDDRVVTYLRESNGESEFTNNILLYPLNLSHPVPITDTSTTIRSSVRFWVIYRNTVDSALYSSLTERCTQIEVTASSPFTATLWENCQS